MTNGGIQIRVFFHFVQQIDAAVLSESRNLVSSLGIQRNKLISRCSDDDPFLAPIRPVRNSAAISSGAAFEPFAFVDSPCPECLTVSGISRDNSSPVSGCEVQNTVDHERRRFRLVFRPAAKIVGPPDPRDL